MARGTDFGGIHSHRDLNLIQQKVEVQPAEPKLNLVDIPGADGAKDLSTQPAGRVTYETRKITWTFALYPGENWDAKHRQVSSALNGRACKITLDTDLGYYFQGRITVKKYKLDNQLRQITVEATCQPWILKQEQTRVFVPFSGKNLFNPADLQLIGGSGCDVSTIDTGVRATWRTGTYSYMVVKWLPIQMLLGKTLAISATITKTGGAQAYLRVGYSNADGSNRIAKTKLYGTGSATLTIGSDAAAYDYLAVWFYATNGEVATEGAYVDYANLQIELGDTATAYEAYTANPGPFVTVLTNERKPVVPTIVCTGETTLTVDGMEVTLAAGTHKVLDFQLEEGETQVALEGTGAAATIYQEGSL